MTSRVQRLALAVLAIVGTVGCDQATKQLATSSLKGAASHSFLGGLFRLEYAENPGAFLSLFGNLSRAAQFWVLTAGVGAVLLAMLVYLLTSKELSRLQAFAIALLVGGGLSNWIDRLTNDGRVVDFMILGVGPVRTGVFNVADIAIMGGVAVVLLSGFLERKAPPSESSPA